MRQFYYPENDAELPDTGFCKENIPRWYYNPFSERCARFTYGGCYGNKNNFEEEQQCLESCRDVSKMMGCNLALYPFLCCFLSGYFISATEGKLEQQVLSQPY